MVTARRRFNPQKLFPWRWLDRVSQPPTARVSPRPHRIERLTKRRLLSVASLQLEPENPPPLTTNPPLPQSTGDSTAPNQHPPRRQHVSDSVLSLISQHDRPPATAEPPSPQMVQRTPTDPARRTRTNLLPQGDPAPPFQLPAGIPQGLFRDGSVRAVHPEIDPHVYRDLQRHELSPIETTLHRPSSPYGAPVTMAAGTNPQLLILAGLQPNWPAATGMLTYSRQSILIPQIKPWLCTETIYRHLKDFRHFNQNNLAQVRIIRAGALAPAALQDRHFALFRVRLLLETKPLDLHWALANTAQGLVNSNPVAVELRYHDKLRMVEAITLGDHMLVGYRRWRVIETSEHSVRITSEAWVRPNGKLNEFAMRSLGPLAMKRIWAQYLANIGSATKLRGSQILHGPSVHHEFTISPKTPWPRITPWPPVERPGIRSMNKPWFTRAIDRIPPRP